MALGICCHWLDERTLPRSGRTEFYNAMDERTLQLRRYRTGKYTSDQISGTYEHNVSALIEMLPRIARAGIGLFRISSAMFPLADQVDASLWQGNERLVDLLSKAGKIITCESQHIQVNSACCHQTQIMLYKRQLLN